MPARQKSVDIEEITPNHFLIHTESAYSVIKSEGVRHGQMFELTSWRRDGLLARLAARQFSTLTLDDRIDALPALPLVSQFGLDGWRSFGSVNERVSVFDPASHEWQPLALEARNGHYGINVRDGSVIRRRKGRGHADYYRVAGEGGVPFQPLDETAALMIGFAQTAELAPLAVPLVPDTEIVLPQLPLPYRDFLRRVGKEGPRGWSFSAAGLPFVARALERLGIVVHSS